jgi:hypothetical protein
MWYLRVCLICQFTRVQFHLPPALASADTLMFSHRVSGAHKSGEYFDNISSALNSTSGDVGAATHKWSRLGALDSMRDIDGALHLRMTWDLDAHGRPGASCFDILSRAPGLPSGTYTIVTKTGLYLPVWCDMTTDGGGYGVIVCGVALGIQFPICFCCYPVEDGVS